MGPLVGQDLSSYYYPGLVDLVHLCVPGHPKADESFVEDRRFGSGNVQRLVLEEVVRHLGNNFCTTSFDLNDLRKRTWKATCVWFECLSASHRSRLELSWLSRYTLIFLFCDIESGQGQGDINSGPSSHPDFIKNYFLRKRMSDLSEQCNNTANADFLLRKA